MTAPAAQDAPFPESPVLPQTFGEDKAIRFRCHRGIGCWNACCSNIDISLTPYDILRLKRQLAITSTEFLERYTVPYEMEKDGIAVVKLKSVDGGTACRFMVPEGCSVYEDRPTACRYYPVALLSMRRQGEATDRDSYAVVKEPHCLGGRRCSAKRRFRSGRMSDRRRTRRAEMTARLERDAAERLAREEEGDACFD